MSASSSSSSHTLIPSPPIHAPVPQTRPLRKYPSNLSRSRAQTPSRPGRDETKYENLEDLLREAGYKETRIFTPEGERNTKDSSDSGILGFISGLLSRPATPSPAPATTRSATPTDGDPTPRASYRPIVLSHYPPPSPPPRLQERESFSSLKRPSSRLNNSFTSASSTSPFVHSPRPSPAVAHLRHMASNTSMHPSRPTHLVRQRSTRSSRTITGYSGEPLPDRWRDNVTQAVASRGGRVGRPSEDGPIPRGRPPSRLLPSRRSASAASVTKVGVVCRSMPSSPVRSTQSHFGKNKGKAKANVPTLRAQHEGAIERFTTPVSPSTPIDDDDDDEVLDLARLLVPPKRQNSIASLRRHLITGQASGVHRYRTWNGGADSEEASEDEEDYMRLVSGHSNRSGGANPRRSRERRRVALPPPWNS